MLTTAGDAARAAALKPFAAMLSLAVAGVEDSSTGTTEAVIGRRSSQSGLSVAITK
ncbi:hypothetical protein FQZ97_1142450 [compost metagenome]